MAGTFRFPKVIRAFLIIVLLALAAVNAQPAQAAGTVYSCTQAALLAALRDGGTVLYGVDCAESPVTLTSTITITENTTIDGNGRKVQINGGNAVRLFIINQGRTLTLNGLHLTTGSSGGAEGGAVLNHGTLEINGSTFSNHTSLGGNGGAIYNNAGTVRITNSTFSGNVTHGNGNSGLGGALYNYNGNVTITNSTISGNGSQPDGGGGIYASRKSGGAPVTTLNNTILYNNQGDNCAVSSTTITDGTGNISYNTGAEYTNGLDASCGAGFLSADPGLTALGDYGSLMPVFALSAETSPAINRGTANCPATDQRGIARSNPCDSGSVEFRFTTTTVVSTPQILYTYGQSITFQAAVTADNGSGTPAGTVRFYTTQHGGTQQIGSSGLVNGVATFTTTFLPAGVYTISARYMGGGNYEISTGVMAEDLTVSPALLTITADDKSRVYHTADPAFTYTPSGFQNGQNSTVFTSWPSCSTTATFDSPAGPYPITCSGGAADNYDFLYEDGELTITGVMLTVTPSNQTRPYGSANPDLTFTISGFMTGDDISDLETPPTCATTAVTSSPASVLPYPITCSGGAGTNYAFNYVTGGLTITKVRLDVTANNHERAYGAANTGLTAQITGFVNGEDASALDSAPVCVSAGPASPVDGSPYQITCAGATSENYSFTYHPGQLTVTRAPLTITANSLSRPYGSANPALTAAYAGFANGETAAVLTAPVSCQTTATTASPVAGSPYAITCSGAEADNYSISYVPGQLTVSRAVLTVKADDKTKNFRSPNPPLTYTITGFVSGETVALVSGKPQLATNATTTSLGGRYPILITRGTLNAANYTFQFVDGTLTIVQYKTFLPSLRR